MLLKSWKCINLKIISANIFLFSTDVDCTNTPRESAEDSNLSSHTDASIIDENGDEYVHRLVQDENAKTILLNVPLESNSTSLGTFLYMFTLFPLEILKVQWTNGEISRLALGTNFADENEKTNHF